MGVEPTQISSSLWGLSNMPFWSVTGPTPEKVMQDAANNFAYDTDWNKLMAVVEKIESLPCGLIVEINGSYTIANGIDQEYYLEYGGETKILNTYRAVVEFIKWYKTQQSI